MMRKALLITSHENYAVTPPHGLEVSVYPVSAEVDLHDAAKHIRTQCNGLSALFVDINLQVGARTDGASPTARGIALVKWLRIMGVRTPIVVLSAKRLETLLMEDAGNMVLASQGTYVTELGPDLARLFADGVAQESTVAPKPMPKRSWLHRLFGRHAGSKEAKEQNTGRVPRKPPAVQLNLNQVLGSQAPEDTKTLAPYFKAGLQLSRDAKHDWANWWGMYVLLRAEEASGTGDVHYPRSLQHAFRDLRNQTALLVHGDGWQELPDHAAAIEKKPTERLEGRRIVFVDDQADEGWAQVLRRVLYGSLEEKVAGFTALSPKPGELADVANYYSGKDGQPGKLMPALYPQEANANPFSGAELLIMDVRLDTENDPEAITDKISGIRLLRHVRDKDPGLPILMFTASQSGEVHRKLIEAGADLVWVKPGVDVAGRTDITEHSVNTLSALRAQVDRLLGREFQVVRKCGVLFQKLQFLRPSPWWLNKMFPAIQVNGVQYFAKKLSDYLNNTQNIDLILGTLADCIVDARSLLREIYMRGDKPMGIDSIKRAQIISRIGSLVELIHSNNDGTLDGRVIAQIGHKYTNRNDYLGLLLYYSRHNASHISSMRLCEQDDLMTNLCAALLYFSNDPIDSVPNSEWIPDLKTLEELKLYSWWRNKKGESLEQHLRKALMASKSHSKLFNQFQI